MDELQVRWEPFQLRDSSTFAGATVNAKADSAPLLIASRPPPVVLPTYNSRNSMSLGPGVRLGSYEIVALIGAGGMGEVYRAHDDRLNRDVAIKTLPAAFAVDPDRLMRFKREAQLLASLNHTNIAAIYGLEEHDGVSALVLELIEGPTLADRIASGPLAIDEALPIARQIAEALEGAHEQGIVHRDLKPANVKVRPDGTVKVLDFGLAKALQPLTAESRDTPVAPTITSPALTQLGVILGTAAYMSPEQAKGRPADKRGDVWAFGAVLYEMLSGQRAFKGEDISEVLAAVLRQDVDWAALPSAVPSAVRRLIARCLERDPKRRLRDIGEARIALDGPFEPPSVEPRARVPLVRRALPLALAALLSALVTAAASWYVIRPPAMFLDVVRLSFTLPAGQSFGASTPGHSIALSPDGQQLVYMANSGLFLRSLGQDDSHLIPGSEGFQAASVPAFSPDGGSIAFFAAETDRFDGSRSTEGARSSSARSTLRMASAGAQTESSSVRAPRASSACRRMAAHRRW